MTCAINDYSNLHERCIDVEILYLEKSKEFRITLKYEFQSCGIEGPMAILVPRWHDFVVTPPVTDKICPQKAIIYTAITAERLYHSILCFTVHTTIFLSSSLPAKCSTRRSSRVCLLSRCACSSYPAPPMRTISLTSSPSTRSSRPLATT